MFIYIPGELISLLTFPGIILHEIAHRFACDLLGIPVYQISYFHISAKTSGHVIHAPTTHASHSFLIGIAPLLINSIVCMLLLLPYALIWKLNTTFVIDDSMNSWVIWGGFSIGFHAIPSNKDMEIAPHLTDNMLFFPFLVFIQGIVALCNVQIIGPILRASYACMLPYMVTSFFV